MADFEYTIRPILGTKTNVPQNDPTLFKSVGEGQALTHDVGGVNFDNLKRRGACSKSTGYSIWSSRSLPVDYFVEADVAGMLTLADVTITATNLDNDVASRTTLNDDTLSIAAGTAFEFRFKLNITSMSDGQVIYPWALSGDADGDENPIQSQTDSVWFSVTRSGANYTPAIAYDFDGSTDSANGSSNISTGTTYYVTLSRATSNTLSLAIETGDWGGSSVSTATLADVDGDTFIWWFAVTNDSSGGGGAAATFTVASNQIISGHTIDTYPFRGLFLQDDGTNLRLFSVTGNGIYRYPGTGVNDPEDLGTISGSSRVHAINFGSHAVYTDTGGGVQPQSHLFNGDTANAISSGTAYRIKYLESFGLRIIGAGVHTSDITNGDVSIIWTGQLPTPITSMTFGSGDPPENHLFRAATDPITGIKRMGTNACFLYGKNSTDVIDYYPNYQTPFAIRNVVATEGAYSQQSIVDTGGRHFFFNKNYGFVEYRGGIEFPYGRPISEDIEDKIATIDYDEYNEISGIFNPYRQEVIFLAPLDSANTPSHFLIYNILERTWRIKDFSATVAAMLDSDYYGNDANNLVMVTGDQGLWLYKHDGDDIDGSDFDGYRIEPIMQFGRVNQRAFIESIWFGITNTGNYSIDVYHRSGDSVGEVEAANWTSIGSVSCNSIDTPAIYPAVNAQRFHQIKWGCNAADEPFEVNTITFSGSVQDVY